MKLLPPRLILMITQSGQRMKMKTKGLEVANEFIRCTGQSEVNFRKGVPFYNTHKQQATFYSFDTNKE